jgi:hypothetical protein
MALFSSAAKIVRMRRLAPATSRSLTVRVEASWNCKRLSVDASPWHPTSVAASRARMMECHSWHCRLPMGQVEKIGFQSLSLGWRRERGLGWTSRSHANEVAPDRMTLRTVFLDTFRSRAISLIVLPLRKCSRRIRPIVSTISIPPPPASNQSEQRITPNGRGSILCTPNNTQVAIQNNSGHP